MPNGAHRPCFRGQNELAMWMVAIVVTMPIDHHATSVSITLTSFVHFIHVAAAGGRGDRDDSRLSWQLSRLLAKSEDTFMLDLPH
ncbi:hypothetical protein Y032_0073g760 [Ancylostoma ceylanicum]|uniref:Uncharacterized protein n=1 Tax=Ancylostoma ceylanicum TaxID=53326 RepID=A0A016TW72_9BILA|nr:hypothetical protein Y032_0073g760 [Ancylostoma ceylanicum]